MRRLFFLLIFLFIISSRLVVAFVSDERLKRRTERNLFVLKSSKTKPLLMRTWSWTRTRVSSTSVVDCFCGFNLFKQGYDVVETFTSSLNLLRFCWPLAELSLRVLMRFIRRKSDGKREGHFTFRGISWMTLPTIEISLIAFGFLVIKGIKITQVLYEIPEFKNSCEG